MLSGSLHLGANTFGLICKQQISNPQSALTFSQILAITLESADKSKRDSLIIFTIIKKSWFAHLYITNIKM